MILIAIQMLIGDRTKCIAIIGGVLLTTILIGLLSAVFSGFISRAYRIVTDIPTPDIWVMHPDSESVDKLRNIPEIDLQKVKGIEGVAWAVPLSRTLLPFRLKNGVFQLAEMIGVDNGSLMGVPLRFLVGNVGDLRREGAVIVDEYSLTTSLASYSPEGQLETFHIGEGLEINEKRAVVVGVTKTIPGFLPQPVVFTTMNNFKRFTGIHRNPLSFILVKASKEVETQKKLALLCQKITEVTGLAAYKREEFEMKCLIFLFKTGILANYALSMFSGLVIGLAITSQLFYLITMGNLPYFALFKTMGVTNKTIIQMIASQGLLVGLIGYGLGMGFIVLFSLAVRGTIIAFALDWRILVGTAIIVIFMCFFSAMVSGYHLMRLDPKDVLTKY